MMFSGYSRLFSIGILLFSFYVARAEALTVSSSGQVTFSVTKTFYQNLPETIESVLTNPRANTDGRRQLIMRMLFDQDLPQNLAAILYLPRVQESLSKDPNADLSAFALYLASAIGSPSFAGILKAVSLASAVRAIGLFPMHGMHSSPPIVLARPGITDDYLYAPPGSTINSLVYKDHLFSHAVSLKEAIAGRILHEYARGKERIDPLFFSLQLFNVAISWRPLWAQKFITGKKHGLPRHPFYETTEYQKFTTKPDAYSELYASLEVAKAARVVGAIGLAQRIVIPLYYFMQDVNWKELAEKDPIRLYATSLQELFAALCPRTFKILEATPGLTFDELEVNLSVRCLHTESSAERTELLATLNELVLLGSEAIDNLSRLPYDPENYRMIAAITLNYRAEQLQRLVNEGKAPESKLREVDIKDKEAVWACTNAVLSYGGVDGLRISAPIVPE